MNVRSLLRSRIGRGPQAKGRMMCVTSLLVQEAEPTRLAISCDD